MTQRMTVLLFLLLCVLTVWSWIGAYDRATWWMETIPGFVGIMVIAITRQRFPLSSLVMVVIFLHVTILLVGGHYTYARVPLGEWAKEWCHVSRNHFDRLGHFAQGFVPALVAREIFIRKHIIHSRGWMLFIILFVCLGISAAYELIEWGAAMSLGQGADEFLATQGDIWDTQEDMAIALVGASAALFLFATLHDKQLRRLVRPRDV